MTQRPRPRARARDYTSYITQQWKRLAEPKGITIQKRTISELNTLLLWTLDRLVEKVQETLKLEPVAGLSWNKCKLACGLVFPRNIRLSAVDYATTQLRIFEENWSSRVFSRKQKCSRLLFSHTVAVNTLRAENLPVDDGSVVFLTAVCEYLSNDILDAVFLSHGTLQTVIHTDDDLKRLFEPVRFVSREYIRMTDPELEQYSIMLQQYTDIPFETEAVFTFKLFMDTTVYGEQLAIADNAGICSAIATSRRHDTITQDDVLALIHLKGFFPVV